MFLFKKNFVCPPLSCISAGVPANYVPTEEISGTDMAEDVSDPTYDPELEENDELMNKYI